MKILPRVDSSDVQVSEYTTRVPGVSMGDNYFRQHLGTQKKTPDPNWVQKYSFYGTNTHLMPKNTQMVKKYSKGKIGIIQNPFFDTRKNIP